ncbi:MAG: hypothetical protein ACRD2L_11210, partial [Terriglobia bacterium]
MSTLLREFEEILQVEFAPDFVLLAQVDDLLEKLQEIAPLPRQDRQEALLAHVNSKFRFNGDRIHDFFTHAANRGVTFNYHEKVEISRAFDLSSTTRLDCFLRTLDAERLDEKLIRELEERFNPLSRKESIRLLHSELTSPTLTRKDSKPRDWSQEILTSLFSAFVYSSFPEQSLHALNDPLTAAQHYEADFWLHLHRNFPKLFSRDNALGVLRVNGSMLASHQKYEALRDFVLDAIRTEYPSISNHGVFAVLIDSDPQQRPG